MTFGRIKKILFLDLSASVDTIDCYILLDWLRFWDWEAPGHAGSTPSAVVSFSWYWWGEVHIQVIPHFVECLRVWSSHPSYLTPVWNHWRTHCVAVCRWYPTSHLNPGLPGDAANGLIQCLEAIQPGDSEWGDRLRFTFARTTWLWLQFGPPVLGILSWRGTSHNLTYEP